MCIVRSLEKSSVILAHVSLPLYAIFHSTVEVLEQTGESIHYRGLYTGCDL